MQRPTTWKGEKELEEFAREPQQAKQEEERRGGRVRLVRRGMSGSGEVAATRVSWPGRGEWLVEGGERRCAGLGLIPSPSVRLFAMRQPVAMRQPGSSLFILERRTAVP